MDLSEFHQKYKQFRCRDKITIRCESEGCLRAESLNKDSAMRNIQLHNGQFICRECAFTDEGRKRISDATSYSRSAETKQKMSDAKKSFYKTEQGLSLRKELSKLTAQGHAENKFENHKRNGWYFSTKINDFVFYGSSYELRLCWQLDQEENVEKYETQVSYETPDNRGRCLDFLIVYKDGTQKAVEVKPKTRLNEQSSICQINDSNAYAKSQNWDFEIITEEQLGMTEKELRNWADEYRSQNADFDWVQFRKDQNCKRTKKHYHSKIAQDKITFFCEYCQTEHTQLKLTYEQNIEKNGRHICHSENIHVSRPGKKKENPYADENMKQCTRCNQILSFASFSPDNSRRDGYCSRCKSCRSEAANERYRLTSNHNSSKSHGGA